MQEGKLDSYVEEKGWWIFKEKILHLKLVQEMDEFENHEKALLRALFFGAKNTDTDRIKKHYKNKGFDPASKIKR